MALIENLLVLREDEDLDGAAAEAAGKSPDSALIGGLVAGLASAAMLALIFYVLWRTRKRTYLTPQPEKIVPIREPSQFSTRSDVPMMDVTLDSEKDEKDGAFRASRASSMSRSRLQEPSLGRASPA